MKAWFERFLLTIRDVRSIRRFLFTFYAVGLLGFILPFTSELFKMLVPLALLLSMFLLAIYHQERFNLKTLLTVLFIYVASMTVEVVGVRTGKIFGVYEYGYSLGPKVFGVPLLIGLNWVFLCYVSMSVAERFVKNTFLQVFFASMTMVFYDVVLEQVAPQLDFWYWGSGVAPFQNYVGWFITALPMNFILAIMRITLKNALAGTLFISQFFFFLSLWVAKLILP